MTRSNKNTFMWEKRLGASVVQDPSAACQLRGQSTGLVSASGLETMDWPSWSTAEYRALMPSFQEVGQQGEVDVTTVVSTQAKATEASLQCGTEGLSPATLIPMDSGTEILPH